MPALNETLFRVLAGVWTAIAAFAGGRVLVPRSRAHLPPTQEDFDRHKLRTEYWVTVYKRVTRLNERFQRLFARWRAGTLPKPRKSRAGQTRVHRPYLRLPTRLGWLNHAVPGISPSTALCERMLRHPDLPGFVAAAPQAMRIIRPLCHMLGLEPPRFAPAKSASAHAEPPPTDPSPGAPRPMPPDVPPRPSPTGSNDPMPSQPTAPPTPIPARPPGASP